MTGSPTQRSLKCKPKWKDKEPSLVEPFLQKEGIIDNSKIKDYERFIDCGLFLFLYWFLSKKCEYYSNPENKKNEKVEGYFNFYVTSIGENIIFLMQTEKDKFVFPKRTGTLIDDPLNYLGNGDRNHESCPLQLLMRYNAAYLEVNKNFNIKFPERDLDTCYDHKTLIKEFITSKEELPSILGGWPIVLNVNKELIGGIESPEQLNEDSLFNGFLATYFKYKLNLQCTCLNNVELEKPFISHEIDALLELDNNKAIIFETSREFEIKSKNLKRKIYNLWSLHKCFKNAVMFYLTFGEFQNNDSTKTFFEFQKNLESQENHLENSPNFEILTFPNSLKHIERSLKEIKGPDDLKRIQKKTKKQFIEFLDELEERVKLYI